MKPSSMLPGSVRRKTNRETPTATTAIATTHATRARMDETKRHD